MSAARIVRVAGALIEARPLLGALYELALVGTHRLLGEIVRQSGDTATIQVYEETSGLALGEPVEAMGTALAAQLGPGLLGSVLDGTGRPLARLADDHWPGWRRLAAISSEQGWPPAPSTHRESGHSSPHSKSAQP